MNWTQAQTIRTYPVDINAFKLARTKRNTINICVIIYKLNFGKRKQITTSLLWILHWLMVQMYNKFHNLFIYIFAFVYWNYKTTIEWCRNGIHPNNERIHRTELNGLHGSCESCYCCSLCMLRFRFDVLIW